MQFTAEQESALNAVSAWLKAGDRQVFRLFGYAGTGKTTLARHLAEGIEGKVCFAAFTGKAAHVMRSRGCVGAGTIHSLIYRPRGEDEAGMSFSLNRDSAAADAKLIVIDECSMVDEELGRDLMSFGTPILVLGDPAQLPPISGAGFFTSAPPDVMLGEVHRQAQDNPIIRLSMAIREGGRLDYGAHGDSRVVGRRDVDRDEVMSADQVLVGRNATRQAYNARIRTLLGRTVPTPVVGDKLVCLRNNKGKGLLNGGLWRVDRMRAERKGLLRFHIEPEEGEYGAPALVTVNPAFFDGTAAGLPPLERRRSDEFDYGYALTVHKAQGSQWDHVVLFDESGVFGENRARWLYTGLTRAAERITVVR